MKKERETFPLPLSEIPKLSSADEVASLTFKNALMSRSSDNKSMDALELSISLSLFLSRLPIRHDRSYHEQ